MSPERWAVFCTELGRTLRHVQGIYVRWVSTATIVWSTIIEQRENAVTRDQVRSHVFTRFEA